MSAVGEWRRQSTKRARERRRTDERDGTRVDDVRRVVRRSEGVETKHGRGIRRARRAGDDDVQLLARAGEAADISRARDTELEVERGVRRERAEGGVGRTRGETTRVIARTRRRRGETRL